MASLGSIGLGKIIKDWAGHSSVHGLPRVVGSRNRSIFRRLIWLACFGVCVGFCIQQIVENSTSYASYSINTKNVLVNSKQNISGFGICNLNAFNEEVPAVKVTIETALKNSGVSTVDNFDKVYNISKLIKTYFYRVNKFERNLVLGFTLEEISLRLKLNDLDCSSYFYSIIDFNYGTCYLFDSNKFWIDYPNQTVSSQKLTLELYSGRRTTQTYSYNTGFNLFFYDDSDNIYPLEDGITLSVGEETNVALSKTVFKRITTPLKTCMNRDLDQTQISTYTDTIKTMIQKYSRKTYFQKTCLKTCLQELIYKACGCYDLSLPTAKLNGWSDTCQSSLFDCAAPIINNRINQDACTNECPYECDQVVYKSNVNKASYPSYWYYTNILLNNPSFLKKITDSFDPLPSEKYSEYYSLAQSSFLKVNIFYDKNYYTLIEESLATTVEDLIVNIGGNLGLFIGITFLSFAEIFEIVLMISFQTYYKLTYLRDIYHAQ